MNNNYSDPRRYNKKKNIVNNDKLIKGVAPKIEIPSYVKERVNKYNYSINRKNNTYRSSFGKVPYSLHSNCSSNYNLHSNISNRNNSFYNSNKKNSTASNRTQRKSSDLNYKYIFFNNE